MGAVRCMIVGPRIVVLSKHREPEGVIILTATYCLVPTAGVGVKSRGRIVMCDAKDSAQNYERQNLRQERT